MICDIHTSGGENFRGRPPERSNRLCFSEEDHGGLRLLSQVGRDLLSLHLHVLKTSGLNS